MKCMFACQRLSPAPYSNTRRSVTVFALKSNTLAQATCMLGQTNRCFCTRNLSQRQVAAPRHEGAYVQYGNAVSCSRHQYHSRSLFTLDSYYPSRKDPAVTKGRRTSSDIVSEFHGTHSRTYSRRSLMLSGRTLKKPSWSSNQECTSDENREPRFLKARNLSTQDTHNLVIFRDGQPVENIEQRDVRAVRSRFAGVRARDLVAVESGRQDTILVRPDVILTNIGDCRALITKDSLTMIDLPRQRMSGNPWDSITNILSRESEQNHYHPFEFRALEAVLEIECNNMRASLEILKPEFFRDLQNLTESIQQSMSNHSPILLRLLSHNKQLFGLEKEVTGIKRAVEAVLLSDEDMAQMYLSHIASTGVPRQEEEHTEIELLLEESLYVVEELEREVFQLKSIARETEEFVNIQLNSQRNAIMSLSLKLNMATLSASMCACVAGIFGMNLTSGFEESAGLFYIVTGMATGVSTVLFGTLLTKGRRLRLW